MDHDPIPNQKAEERKVVPTCAGRFRYGPGVSGIRRTQAEIQVPQEVQSVQTLGPIGSYRLSDLWGGIPINIRAQAQAA